VPKVRARSTEVQPLFMDHLFGGLGVDAEVIDIKSGPASGRRRGALRVTDFRPTRYPSWQPGTPRNTGLDRPAMSGDGLYVNVQQEFWRRLKQEWLPAYCNDPDRQYDVAGFRADAKQVTDIDARDFMRAIDQKIVSVDSGGRFRMPRSNVNEVIFWEHSAKISPRPISLWIEPIITIAAVARLHLDFGWPTECLGMQSKEWAFDLMAFTPNDLENEFIAGEVKASRKESDSFLAHLQECCTAGEHDCAEANLGRRNAHKKWRGLMRCRAPIFWAIGPGDDSRIFRVLYDDSCRISLSVTTDAALYFAAIRK
jgi:hypothetical protein